MTPTILARDFSAPPVQVKTDEQVSLIKKAMRAYENFPTLSAAVEALNKAGMATSDFLGLPMFAHGVTVGTVDGKPAYIIDPGTPANGDEPAKPSGESIYEGAQATLGYVAGNVKGADGKSQSVIKAINLFPTFMAPALAESAPDLLEKVVNKELRHVYYRGFRDAASWDELNMGFAASPTTVEAYAASHARTAAEELDTDTFDAVWPAYRKWIAANSPALASVLPPKQEVIKAIRSESYATTLYSALEAKNAFLMVAAAIAQIAAKQTPPLNADAVKGWAQNRKTTHIATKVASAEQLDQIGTFDAAKAAADLGLSA